MVMMNIKHKPVMLEEAIAALNLRAGMTVVDATIGSGGHSLEIAGKIFPGGRLIGIDRDEESLLTARETLKEFGDRVSFIHSDFRNIDGILEGLNLKKIDAVLLDLGISSRQLDARERGFSFRYDGPLDMRMDQTSYISAYDLVNNLTEKELSDILWQFGEERWHNRIARHLIRERERNPVATTGQLKDIVMKSIPNRFAGAGRIHPATRTFQALRIAVNRELEALKELLDKIPYFLNDQARICVISFHSLEDRIVKQNFRGLAQEGIYRIITKKPIEPSESEVKDNPRSRSAKMRAAQKEG